MYQFVLVNTYAKLRLRAAFDALNAEKEIVEHQNREKTVLLQEIHHRVKNNMQVIVSLLRMQAREIVSEETKESFEDAITRIMSMSLIHQKMYEKESLIDIDIKDYLSTLIEKLINNSAVNKEISFQVNSTKKVPSLAPSLLMTA